MRKSLACLLAVCFMLSTACTAFASSTKTINPYKDVPTDHWAYASVEKLTKAGIIDGYSNDMFGGDKQITRYEMAELVARALSRIEKANDAQLLEIAKLQKEFSLELKKIGVRLSRLERKTDKTKWSGEIRARYSHDDLKNGNPLLTSKDVEMKLRTRLMVDGEINKDWSYFGRFENEQSLRDSGTEGNTELNAAYLQGPLGVSGVKFTLGRIPYIPAYGMVVDSTFDGLRFDFGNKLKVSLFYGKEDLKSTSVNLADGKVSTTGGDRFLVSHGLWGSPELRASGYVAPILDARKDAVHDTYVSGLEMSYALDSKSSIKAAYLYYESPDLPDDYSGSAGFAEIGIDRKLNDKFTARYAYTRSDADTENSAHLFGLKFKQFDLKKPKSYDVYAQYRNFGKYATYYSTYDTANIMNILPVIQQDWPSGIPSPSDQMNNNLPHGAKGLEFGVNYVLDKDILLHTYFTDMKATDNTDLKQRLFRAQVFFFF